jgi:hypothetical protein
MLSPVVLAYKSLSTGALGLFSGFRWPTPAPGRPGEWVEAGGPISACERGIHAYTVRDLLGWLDEELWRIELGGAVIEADSMLVAERGRLLGRVDAWTAELAEELAETCARRGQKTAVRALQSARLAADADALERGRELGGIRELAGRAAARAGGPVGELVAFAADAVGFLDGRQSWDGPPPAFIPPRSTTAASVAYLVAHCAGLEAALTRSGSYAAGFAAERGWQLDWLVSRLGLSP